MTKYREILRLSSLEFSERNIALSCSVSRNTVAKVLNVAKEANISWPLDESQTDKVLETLLFPKDTVQKRTERPLPDFAYIRKELLHNGVSKKLLWTEYCEMCRMDGKEPLMYSQFCYYIQQDEQKRRATMHIPRKPGEQAEVDWAGDAAHIIDPDTGVITEAWIFVGVLSYSQYAYAEAFINEKEKAWITANIHMLEFFGGVPRIIVPDNTTTAVNHSEYTTRKNNRYKRLIRSAELEQPDASIAGIDYHSGRKLNRDLINRLATCDYISDYRNIFITGAIGSGKTYLACAFGLAACKKYYSTKFVRMPDMLLELQEARDNGNFSKVLTKYTKPVLLIIDEWLLIKLNDQEVVSPQ